jgi:hypothetical protein
LVGSSEIIIVLGARVKPQNGVFGNFGCPGVQTDSLPKLANQRAKTLGTTGPAFTLKRPQTGRLSPSPSSTNQPPKKCAATQKADENPAPTVTFRCTDDGFTNRQFHAQFQPKLLETWRFLPQTLRNRHKSGRFHRALAGCG